MTKKMTASPDPSVSAERVSSQLFASKLAVGADLVSSGKITLALCGFKLA